MWKTLHFTSLHFTSLHFTSLSTNCVGKAKSRSNSGFTLIELSIVMVIIGLVIGGVLVGQDLIGSAKNRSYVSQLVSYNSAVNAFKLKYNCLPGDCANATDYGLTSNGNGNGYIDGLLTEASWSSASGSINSSDTFVSVYLLFGLEANYTWVHLRQAGFITEYSVMPGVMDGVGTSCNLAAAKNDGSGIVLTSWGGKNYFRSGAIAVRSSGNVIFQLNFSPKDAAYIYSKVGGNKITTTNNHPDLYPDGLGHDRVIVSGFDSTWNGGGAYPGIYDIRFWHFQSQGAGGAGSNVCIDTSVTPAFFNVKNPALLCALIIQADF